MTSDDVFSKDVSAQMVVLCDFGTLPPLYLLLPLQLHLVLLMDAMKHHPENNYDDQMPFLFKLLYVYLTTFSVSLYML